MNDLLLETISFIASQKDQPIDYRIGLIESLLGPREAPDPSQTIDIPYLVAEHPEERK